MPHRFAHTFQAPEWANGGQHMGGISALPPTGFEPPTRAKLLQQKIEQTSLGSMSQQAAPKFGEDRKVKPRGGEFQAYSILPVNPRADGIRGLPVGQAFRILEDGDQSQTPRRLGWLTTGGKEIEKIVVLIQRSQHIAHLQIEAAVRKHGMRDTGGFSLRIGGMAWGCNDIYGLLGGVMASSLQSLIFLNYSSPAIRQQYLTVALPGW